MRILHTSDWHLGRTLKGIALDDAHRTAIDRIAQIVEERDVELVIIAGDVYDRAIPHTDAVKLLGRALSTLCQQVPVVVTPGNHDSAVRLGFGAGLFTDRLHVRAALAEADSPVLLRDEHGDVAIYPLPYLDAEEVRQFARREDDLDVARSQAAATEYVMARVRADLDRRGGVRSVVVAHAFVVDAARVEPAAGAEPDQARGATSDPPGDPTSEFGSESERDITAGGLDVVPTSTFDGVSYVALGHLHGAQTRTPTASGTVLEYSGSPLRFSFSERDHVKSVTLVELAADATVTTERIALPQPRGMAQLRGQMDDFLRAAEDPPAGPFADHVDNWVDVTITDQRRPEDMRTRLLRAFPHLLSHRHEPEGGGAESASGLGGSVSAQAAPLTIMKEFVSEVSSGPIDADELAVLTEVADEVFGTGV
ncbi:MAG: exonuclease SbcCD subunit D [Candidatus Nanopelagicales bacterium]